MTWKEYQDYFAGILENNSPEHPYDDPAYLHYITLNMSRQNRWLKTGILTERTKEFLHSIKEEQNWIVITEPWCGDAAHTVPFLHLMSEENEHIHFSFQLRDNGSEIENYLTGTSKSVPILIVRNEKGEDLFHWGPRPVPCKVLYEKLKAENADLETLKIELQKWYNADKGEAIQKEIIAELQKFKL